MGSFFGRGCCKVMTLWSGNSKDETDARTRLERKLYLARESPEPEFDLSGCGLRQVPSGVFSLCRVLRKERLLLHDNCLKTLTGGGKLSDLHLLTVLNISNNKFSNLTDDIKLLVNLRELYVSHNLLHSLPESIGDLVNLQILDVSSNYMKELPKTLGQLKHLRLINILNNPQLVSLCSELYEALNIVNIELDADNFTFPPTSVTKNGTAAIMRFLCEAAGVTYQPPLENSPELTPVQSPNYLETTFQNKLQAEWESLESAALAEKKLHEAAKFQRQKFLSEVLREQDELDAEIMKIQGEREVERLKLIQEIQEQERTVATFTDNLISSIERKPEILQQQFEHERAEHDRLLELCRDNYRSVRTVDVLRAMETMLEEQAVAQQSLRNYEDSLGDVKRTTLLQELQLSDQLERVLKMKDMTHFSLVEQLLRDENVQKAAVASLLERVDARSWSLKQEISIVASNLAKLSSIEQEKRRLEVNYNYDRLLHQRVQLLELLDQLLEQQTRRRTQLVQTLKDMENATDYSTDYWLANYQRLMDSAPRTILTANRILDPLLANYLLEEGVIHCLPFLVNYIFSGTIHDITRENLLSNGVILSSDRENIMRAVKNYCETKNNKSVPLDEAERVEKSRLEPSAPPKEIMEESFGEINGIVEETVTAKSECVICMDAGCEVVFTPCGHMCCCVQCADKQVDQCPMCRVTIDKKIRVIIP